MQLKALEKDKEIALQKLNYLINDGTFYQNEKGKYKILNFESLSTDYAGNPLVLKQLEQEKNIQNAKLATEKPNLSQVSTLLTTIQACMETAQTTNSTTILQDFILG
jgi:hypothetical protein